MTRYMAVFLAILIQVSAHAKPTAVPDLSSPEKALSAYMSLERKGGTEGEFVNLQSKENYAVCFAGDDTDEIKSQLNEAVPGENKYEKTTILKQKIAEDRAIFHLKVKYTEEWLKKDAELNKREGQKNVSIPPVSDPNPGWFFEHPFQVNGEGFLSLSFVRQDGAWRIHKSYASKLPSDFTPLLKAKNLLSGLSLLHVTQQSSKSNNTPGKKQ